MLRPRYLWIILFAVSFAFVESSVVVYLRALYYPDGFSFPLKPMMTSHVAVEFFREFSTILMLIAAGMLAGSTRWQRMAWFMIAFGFWDIFYYVWLKILLDWPMSLLNWDVLFLIPIPWISPVIAPVLISCLLIFTGTMIVRKESGGIVFHLPVISWWLAVMGTVCILISFVHDTDATLRFFAPAPFLYWLFLWGVGFYLAGIIAAFWNKTGVPGSP